MGKPSRMLVGCLLMGVGSAMGCEWATSGEAERSATLDLHLGTNSSSPGDDLHYTACTCNYACPDDWWVFLTNLTCVYSDADPSNLAPSGLLPPDDPSTTQIHNACSMHGDEGNYVYGNLGCVAVDENGNIKEDARRSWWAAGPAPRAAPLARRLSRER